MKLAALKQSAKKQKPSNPYIQALYSEHKGWAFDKASAARFKSRWRELVFKSPSAAPLHLEIGPGNGRRFAWLCLSQPKSCFLSIEMKYKPLAQTIRRIRKSKSQNGRAIRCDARRIEDLFEEGELNNVYIHFPDPWQKKRRQKKHQLFQEGFCASLYKLQKPGSLLELKTDSEDYLRSSAHCLKKAGYRLKEKRADLYSGAAKAEARLGSEKNSEAAYKKKPAEEPISQFELLFFQKNIPVKYALFERPDS